LKLTTFIGVLATLKKYYLMLQPVIFIFVLLFVGVVQAQNIPSKPIQIILNCPSGSSDISTLVVGQKLDELWSQPEAVEVEKVTYVKLFKDNSIKVDY
jgi:hypothetical protein